ncbi:MAG: DNA alkylation repair protein [Clostridia bacterium]|nr:DNA alkylation repair protein [Clostridia bacterium]
MTDIQKKLFEMQDLSYRDFHSRLMPETDKEKVIGVRTPELRKYAKQLYGTPEADKFLSQLPHKYYEEDNLHAFLIEQINDYGEIIAKLDEFLPYIDNWATCDMMKPKIFKKHLPKLKEKCFEWLDSPHTYAVRFGIVMLMTHFLDDEFDISIPEKISQIRSEEYYIKMAVAWYFATALAKRYDETIPFIKNNKLDLWTHNKAIQKAKESYRIRQEHKDFLNTMKI